MIIVKISGGLGNQLFQYCFGKYLEELLSVTIKFDIQTVVKNRDFTIRNFELGFLNNSISIASPDEISRLKIFGRIFLYRLERKIVQRFPGLSNTQFVEYLFNSDKQFKYFKDNCYYDGYWQMYKYINGIEKSILREINLNNLLSRTNVDLLHEIQNCESVSIHIRRGDYLSVKSNSNLFYSCDRKYFEQAINIIRKYNSESRFYIFSDDINWAKANIVAHDCFYVSGNNALVDLYLMSHCKHNIIANSTFSWWGAWLNENRNKIVIAPKQWYKGTKLNETTKNLIPDEWKRI